MTSLPVASIIAIQVLGRWPRGALLDLGKVLASMDDSMATVYLRRPLLVIHRRDRRGLRGPAIAFRDDSKWTLRRN